MTMIDMRDVRIDTFTAWPASVHVKVTHVPTGLTGEGTDATCNQLAARRSAMQQLEEKLAALAKPAGSS